MEHEASAGWLKHACDVCRTIIQTNDSNKIDGAALADMLRALGQIDPAGGSYYETSGVLPDAEPVLYFQVCSRPPSSDSQGVMIHTFILCTPILHLGGCPCWIGAMPVISCRQGQPANCVKCQDHTASRQPILQRFGPQPADIALMHSESMMLASL